MARWISKAEYSRKYEMCRSSVTKAVQAGRLPCRGSKVDGDVDIRQYRRREPANDDAALHRSPVPAPALAPAAADPELDDSDLALESTPAMRRRSGRSAADIPDDELGEALQRARIDKLNADIAVQRQKDLRTRQAWRREDLSEFAGAFSESFAPFKNSLVKLRLTTEELQHLGAAWDKCFSTFITRLEDMELADESSATSE